MLRSVDLHYGDGLTFDWTYDPDRMLSVFRAPPPSDHPADLIRQALRNPLELPPLDQFFVPGDKVTLALDRRTPQADLVVKELVGTLLSCGVEPATMTVLQPAVLEAEPVIDPRRLLPPDVQRDMRHVIHDPTDQKAQGYLASTSRGMRVYLARDLLDADVVLSVGWIGYDQQLGFRGTGSVFYPGLSSVEAFTKTQGQGHAELGPEDERPLRQEIDEIAWLLGNLFTLQVMPSRSGGVAQAWAGAGDAVLKKGRQYLHDHWRVAADRRADLVVVAIEQDAAGHGWSQLGAALATARNLVCRGGKIVVLSELSAPLGRGLEMVRSCDNLRTVLQQLNQAHPLDLLPATQLARAAD